MFLKVNHNLRPWRCIGNHHNRMKKYRKKPVVIEAIQLKVDNFDVVCDFMGGTPIPKHNPNFGVDEHGNTNEPYLGVYIETLEGKMLANYGDYIIKGVNGEFYPCKPDIFEKTYNEEPDDKSGRLKQAATPLIKLLCEEYHPHCTAIVTPTGVELLEAVATVQNIYDHIVD